MGSALASSGEGGGTALSPDDLSTLRGRSTSAGALARSNSATLTASPSPSSCRSCRRSLARPFAESVGTATENSNPMFSSDPERSFGRIFVPKRFHTSGSRLPERRSVRVEAVGSAPERGAGLGGGVGVVTGIGSGSAGPAGVTEKALPKARKGPGSSVLERRRPVALDVPGPDRFIEKRFGFEGCDDGQLFFVTSFDRRLRARRRKRPVARVLSRGLPSH
jgi:hypothetical protein